MRLVSIEDLHNALKEKGVDGIATMLRSALNLVTPALVEYLGTSFDRTDLVTEVFFVDPYKKGLQQYPKMFLLSRGLIDPSVAVMLRVYADESMMDGTDLYCPLSVDYERGIVCPVTQIPKGVWVAITYSAGLREKDGQYQGVPEWLQAAAIKYGMVVYQRLLCAQKRKQNGGIAYQVGYLDGIPMEVVTLLKEYMNCMPLAYTAVEHRQGLQLTSISG